MIWGSRSSIAVYRETGRASLDEALETALEVRTREDAPLDWATTQNNLGIALKVLGDRTRQIALTGRAAETFRGVLEVNTREMTPLEWVTELCVRPLGAALDDGRWPKMLSADCRCVRSS
jgi:hypothetical protein